MTLYLGDFNAGDTIDFKFTTVDDTGAPTTLAGTPALSAYKGNSVTQDTDGITLTADFDSVTGLNHVNIDTSADGTFYAAGSDIQIVITTGTVDSVSVVGYVVAHFSLANRTTANIETDTQDIQSRLPATLVSGRMDSNMQAAANGVITAAVIATDAIDDDALAADAVTAIQSGLATAAAVTTVDGNVDSILVDTNELQTDWTNGGRLDLIIDAILADTNELQSDDVPGLIATLSAALATVDGNVDDILVDTGTTIPALIDALPTAAEVNAEVVDALATDTYAEPGSVPAATATLAAKIGWLYVLARNKITQTSTTQAVRNDADGADVATATVSDDGSQAVRGEWT